MHTFVKLTEAIDYGGDEIWISKHQIIYMTKDKRHSQTFIHTTIKEIVVIESISEIILKFQAKD